jgi:hypothetical protein
LPSLLFIPLAHFEKGKDQMGGKYKKDKMDETNWYIFSVFLTVACRCRRDRPWYFTARYLHLALPKAKHSNKKCKI